MACVLILGPSHCAGDKTAYTVTKPLHTSWSLAEQLCFLRNTGPRLDTCLLRGLEDLCLPTNSILPIFSLFLHFSPHLSVREIYVRMHIFYFTGFCALFQCWYVDASSKGYLLIRRHPSIWDQTVSLPVQCCDSSSPFPSACISREVWGQIQSCNNLKSICLPQKAEERGNPVNCILAPSGLSCSWV